MNVTSKLVISIVNYNTRGLLGNCLKSIDSASIPIDYAVVIGDNNSTDGSSEMVISLFPAVKVMNYRSNIGFGRANNEIIRNTKSSYILILNPDIIVTPKSIESVIKFMDEHKDIGIVGCKLLNPDKTLQYSCRRFPDVITIFLRGVFMEALFPRANVFRNYMMTDWDHASVADVDWVMGSCIFLRRAAADEVGLFDEKFFMYYEDVDLCARMWKKWKVCYFPSACMIHHHKQESHRLLALKQRYIHAKSACRFFSKHGLFPQRSAPADRRQQ